MDISTLPEHPGDYLPIFPSVFTLLVAQILGGLWVTVSSSAARCKRQAVRQEFSMAISLFQEHAHECAVDLPAG